LNQTAALIKNLYAGKTSPKSAKHQAIIMVTECLVIIDAITIFTLKPVSIGTIQPVLHLLINKLLLFSWENPAAQTEKVYFMMIIQKFAKIRQLILVPTSSRVWVLAIAMRSCFSA
jgi:hypothetical protein